MSSARKIAIPNIEITFHQLVKACRQLEPEERLGLARALRETELDERMTDLIARLASRPAADDKSDSEIAAEVQAVRQQKTEPC